MLIVMFVMFVFMMLVLVLLVVIKASVSFKFHDLKTFKLNKKLMLTLNIKTTSLRDSWTVSTIKASLVCTIVEKCHLHSCVMYPKGLQQLTFKTQFGLSAYKFAAHELGNE